jgi:hypothetical protein
MSKIVNGIKNYLSDWKNWVVHGLVGTSMLFVTLFAPVSPYVRLGLVAAVVGFNVVRMRLL